MSQDKPNAERRAIVADRVFDGRGWHRGMAVPSVLPSAPKRHATPLSVHVWTPVGSAESPTPERRPLIGA